MRKKSPSRVRRDAKQWSEILRRFESSGLDRSEFCRREDVAVSSFQRWHHRLGSVAAPVAAAEFVELVPTSSPSVPSSSWSLEVSLPNGVCLRFQG